MTKTRVTNEHGTYRRYLQKCRCDLCREANTEYHRRMRNERAAYEPSIHNYSTYVNWKCRCDVCKAAAKAARPKKKTTK